MKRRLLLSYLSLAAIVLILLEIPIGLFHAREERNALVAQAQRDAQVLAAVAVDAGGAHGRGLVTLTSLAKHYGQQGHGEIVIYGSGGRAVVDVGLGQPPTVRGHGPSAQVVAALAGTASSSWHNQDGRSVLTWATPIAGPGSGAVSVTLTATETDNNIRTIWLALGGLAVLVLLVTAGVGLWLAQSLIRPLARLGATVDKLGRGDLGVRAATAGPAEVRALAVEFNDMAARLEDLVGAQQRFVADASHQLRTPLTALRLRLENLELAIVEGASVGGGRSIPVDPNLAVDDVVAAHREVLRLSRLVEGLLVLSRAEGAPVERQPVSVSAVIEERQAAWAPLADERRIDLDLEPPMRSSNEWVLLAPGDLEQILDNLLANALDKTPPERTIVIRWEATPLGVELHVIDQGPGMTDEHRARAFDRFWQGPDQRGGSSGLGLAIVLQLLRRNGGRIELRPADGGGLDVTVQLDRGPLGREPAGARLSSL